MIRPGCLYSCCVLPSGFGPSTDARKKSCRSAKTPRHNWAGHNPPSLIIFPSQPFQRDKLRSQAPPAARPSGEHQRIGRDGHSPSNFQPFLLRRGKIPRRREPFLTCNVQRLAIGGRIQSRPYVCGLGRKERTAFPVTYPTARVPDGHGSIFAVRARFSLGRKRRRPA